MKRENVYKLIDGERGYQQQHHDPVDDAETSVAAWIIYMEAQIAQAKSAIYNLRKDIALEHIRKIAALSVVCMEENHTEPRKES